jgi:hypothetical protein
LGPVALCAARLLREDLFAADLGQSLICRWGS